MKATNQVTSDFENEFESAFAPKQVMHNSVNFLCRKFNAISYSSDINFF